MEFRIEPSSDLNLTFKGKKIGKLVALVLDTNNTSLLGIPKISLSIVIREAAFDGDTKTCNEVAQKLNKLKFLDVAIQRAPSAV